MNYEITNLTNEVIDETLIASVIECTAKKLKVKKSLVEINLIDNKRIQEINRDYRKKDYSTDVISFAFQDTLDIKINGYTNLGEIYISLEKAHSQSEEYGHSFNRELGFLTVHGLLHLLGYDHIEKEDEIIMIKIEEEILKELGLER